MNPHLDNHENDWREENAQRQQERRSRNAPVKPWFEQEPPPEEPEEYCEFCGEVATERCNSCGVELCINCCHRDKNRDDIVRCDNCFIEEKPDA